MIENLAGQTLASFIGQVKIHETGMLEDEAKVLKQLPGSNQTRKRLTIQTGGCDLNLYQRLRGSFN